jgi:hypothetical protein
MGETTIRKPQEHAAHQREDGSIGADAQRQRQHHLERKPFGSSERAHRNSQIVKFYRAATRTPGARSSGLCGKNLNPRGDFDEEYSLNRASLCVSQGRPMAQPISIGSAQDADLFGGTGFYVQVTDNYEGGNKASHPVSDARESVYGI